MAIRSRAVSAAEVLEAHLSRIAEYNPRLNAIVTLDADGARRRAELADRALERGDLWGPLHGVPVTVKDTFCTAGMRTTAGFPALVDYVPQEDATVVRRFREAGAIVLGKTNVPSLAFDWQSSNPLFGRTNNPWDLGRTAGGSSGGAAAAVAGRLIPLDIGSDLGGSIRVPAHFCGVFGLKPTDRRVSRVGHIPELPGRPLAVRWMSQAGPIARTVEDLELALRCIAGPDRRLWDLPPVSLGGVETRPLASYRIAWTDRHPDVLPSETIQATVTGWADRLARLGCSVRRLSPEECRFLHDAWIAWAQLLVVQLSGALLEEEWERFLQEKGFCPDADDPVRRASAQVDPSYRSLALLLQERDRWIGAIEGLFEEFDLMLLPAAATIAFPHCPYGTAIRIEGREVPYFSAVSAFAAPFNFTGHPALVFPASLSPEGLPIGLQLVGPLWEEGRLLGFAQRLAEQEGVGSPRPPHFEGRKGDPSDLAIRYPASRNQSR